MIHILVLWSRDPQPCVFMERLLAEAAVFLQQMAWVTENWSQIPAHWLSWEKVWKLRNTWPLFLLWRFESCKWLSNIHVKQLFKKLIYFYFRIKKYSSYKPKTIINYFSNIIWASSVVTMQIPDTKILHGWKQPQKNLKSWMQVEFLFPFIEEFQS